VIRAAAWLCRQHHGVFMASGDSWQRPTPADLPSIVGRPIKYAQRLTDEAWNCLCAASLARKAAKIETSEIGLLTAGTEGYRNAQENYFRDYVDNGRALGRGNLFIYTLPTSVAGEVGIVLSLRGPCLFIRDEVRPLPALLEHARQMLSDGEADAMLLLWSDSSAAICLAVDGNAESQAFPLGLESSPSELCRQLQQLVLGL